MDKVGVGQSGDRLPGEVWGWWQGADPFLKDRPWARPSGEFVIETATRGRWLHDGSPLELRGSQGCWPMGRWTSVAP